MHTSKENNPCNFLIRFLFRSAGLSSLHLGRECLRSFGVVFYLAKGSIYAKPMGEVIVRLKEAGIADKHVR